ncbi:MAG: hypothetical protein ABJ308_12045 [Halieaceae bacterium]
MSDAKPAKPQAGAEADDAISIVQRGNLKSLEATLRKQWRLGQNIVLCWSATENGILVLLVPHYFLGNYSAAAEDKDKDHNSNESFIRRLISGQRRKKRDEFFEVANRLGVSATFIKLSAPLGEEKLVTEAVEEIIRRYGISYVSSRAVLLFDIAEFSLYTPFEQASQLNSLSYSMNSAYNKLLTRGIEINFARTTTGDGYYVWNRDLSAAANEDLLHFLLLVIADNALAREASKGNTVPVIRSAFHIGSHYELYQAEGVNPTVFSYIVGDVTIELARMVDLAMPGQIFIGDFEVELPTPDKGDDQDTVTLDTMAFLDRCNTDSERLLGVQLAGQAIAGLGCKVTQTEAADGNNSVRRFKLTDKHGISRHAFNLQLDIETRAGERWAFGLSGDKLPARTAADAGSDGAGESADDSFEQLKRRSKKMVSED